MIFRQLFEPESSTYTYILACPETRQAVLVDPVLDAVDRDLAVVQDLGLTLAYTLETHVHADHITSAARLRSLVGTKIACPEMDGLAEADVGVSEMQPLEVGGIRLQPLFTPGHTDSHHSYLVETPDVIRVMTGDALLIDGCGRTDFQGGSAETLYHSIHDKIFTLPDDALVYPGHDYHHSHVTTVSQERQRNPRLGGGKSVEEFVAIMAALKLPYPKKMEVAVPANLRCGESS
ncbi:MAG TPA: MBL fold metallo-hydrolase [Sphingomicrobium sp.]|nr:MBL fold metallo-hydrolase [Sphingomicrobium sp.]